MDNFEKLLSRIPNMKCYGMSRDDVREQLRAEGVPDEVVYFAWVAVELLEAAATAPH